ncbi:MAG: LamG-like jellyroll fold domain-containing protein, partial [Candidatus Sifarchaeia archaeon]
MKKTLVSFAIIFIFLVPIVSGPAPEERFPFSEKAGSDGDNFVPSDWQSANSGNGEPLSGTLNGFKVSSGTSVIDYSHSAYVGIDPPLGWSSEQLEGQLEHLSMWVDAPLVNPNLNAYHEEHIFTTANPEYNDDPFYIPDGWTIVKFDASGGTEHPQHGVFEVNGYSGNGYDNSWGWRFDANPSSGTTLNPSNQMYFSQQIPIPWRSIYSAEIKFRYYVSSTSILDDDVFIFTRVEDYISKNNVFVSGTPMDTWFQATNIVPTSAFQSIENLGSMIFDIGLGTDITGIPGSSVHEVYIDDVELRLQVRPFPEQIDLLANGLKVTGSTQGSVSPYVPDGSNRDCYSAPDSNGGSGGVDLNGYGDNGWLDVGADVPAYPDWTTAFDYQVGLQFPLYIPQGAAINSATLQVEASSDSTGFPGMRIYVAAEDDVSAFTSGYPLLPDRYDWVNTSIYWRPLTWTVNGRYDSPDIAALIQEVVSRPGWQSGNYISIMIDYAYSNQQYTYNQIKGSSGFAQADLARLFVEYIDSAPSDVIPSFRFNKNLVIDHSKVVSYLQDFPVLVDIWDEDLHLDVQADGDDIAFLFNGQAIPHDLELFDKQGNGTHAHLVCWVKVPELSSVEDTTIVMVYGDDDLGSQEKPDEVWDSNYSAVWHLNDNPSQPQWDSAYADYLPHQPQIKDSTSHGLDGSTGGTMTPTDSVSGYIGSAIDLEGVNDYVDFGNPTELRRTGAFTVEAWFNADFIDNDYLVVKSGGSNYRGWDISFDDDSSISPAGWVMFRYSPDGVNTDIVGYERVDTGKWYHVVGVFYPSSYARFYLNGELVDEVTTGIPASVNDPNQPVRIGRRSDNPGGTSYLDAIVDEVRISSIARSDAWIRTQYSNQRNPGLFLTVSQENVNFQYMKDITIEHNKVASNLKNFPVLIDIYDSDLRTNVQPDGDDIMFVSNGRSLPHEIELFDQQHNSTHAHLVAWVKADLSSVFDTVITMYYSNPAMGNQECSEEVWKNRYQGVWHLGNDPSYVLPVPQITDSGYYGNDGTTYGSMTQDDRVLGQIGNALDFDGSNDYIDCGNTTPLTVGYNDFVMSLWFATLDINVPLAMKGAIGTDAYRYMLSVTGSGEIKAEIDDNSVSPGKISIYSTPGLNDGLWHYAVMMRNGSLLHLFIDGSEVPTSPVDITGYGSINSVEPFLMAACDNYDNAGSPNLFAAAQLDEVRVLVDILSPQWILTEFNNQYDSSSFYSVGIEREVIIPKEVPLRFMYKKDIIIDHNKVVSDLAGFPVLIELYDPDLRTDVQADGDDIVFVKDGWILPHELELFDKSYNSSHAHLIAWVRMDLASLSDTVFSMYYGDPYSESYEDSEGVWDTSFAAVWHLSEDPAGTVYDSTANGNDGIGRPFGSEPTLQTGKIVGCSELYGEATNDRIEAPHSSSLVLPSDMLVEAWIRTSNADATSDTIVAKWGDVGHRNYWLGKLDDSTLAFYVDNTQSVTASFSLVNDGYWHHVVGV